jgi:hypothetical protein
VQINRQEPAGKVMIKTMEELKAVMAAGVVFDWDEAAILIYAYNRYGTLGTAYARMCGDGNKQILIWKDGQPAPRPEVFPFISHDCFELYIGSGGGITDDQPIYNCFCPQSDHPDWIENTYWPQSALDILTKKDTL